jgi:hypothetical protein
LAVVMRPTSSRLICMVYNRFHCACHDMAPVQGRGHLFPVLYC